MFCIDEDSLLPITDKDKLFVDTYNSLVNYRKYNSSTIPVFHIALQINLANLHKYNWLAEWQQLYNVNDTELEPLKYNVNDIELEPLKYDLVNSQ